MSESGADEHQSTVAIRKGANSSCTAAYFTIYPFRQVIRVDPSLVFGWKPPFPVLLPYFPVHGLL